jgi:UDP-N-acetylmuramyl tripeptide synthase
VRAVAHFLALFFEAPLDEMLSDTEAAEWAAMSAVELLAGRPALPLEPKRTEIAAMLVRDLDWRLPALEAEAARNRVPFTWDDELVSLGQGGRALHFDRHRLPDPSTVAWASLGSVPIALITGTNGKTTSTRLLAHMAKEAGLKVGSCSSDAVIVDGKTVREGDWTGPAAARLVLRSPDVEVAILETARGGILRRGLAYEKADVALITNLTDDHLGTYGIESLDDMLQVKAVTARAAKVAVLNANDPRLSTLEHPNITLFALRADELIRAHCAKGGRAVVVREGQIAVLHGSKEELLLPVADVPITFNGEARYNIENVLGAVAAAQALGIPSPAIIRALRSFTAADNPGRGETWTRAGVTLFLDFAHNPEGVAAALRVAGSLRKQGELLVITGSAGDRTDAELEAIVERICAAGPSLVLVRELTHYLRGRAPGEVPQLLRRALEARGNKTALGSSEVECLELALKRARPGDVVALLVHVERDEVRTFLEAGGWQRG